MKAAEKEAEVREWIPFTIGVIALIACAILRVLANQVLPQSPAVPSPTATTVQVLASNHDLSTTSVPTIISPSTPSILAPRAPVHALVMEQRVNMRAGPTTDARVVGHIKKDALVALVDRNADGTWYKALTIGATRPNWVFGETVRISSGDPQSLEAVQP